MKKIFILGISSDIGSYLAKEYLKRGYSVRGTFRNTSESILELFRLGCILDQLDIKNNNDLINYCSQLNSQMYIWDHFISAIGLLEPIGDFYDNDINSWTESIEVNSLLQLKFLHSIRNYVDYSGVGRVIFFAGGGTNGTFDKYSAYCIGKMILIKMCELLQSEDSKLIYSIIGTGWVNTKIHNQTIKAGSNAGINYEKTQKFIIEKELERNEYNQILECIDWCFSADKKAVGGRNFSLINDPWRNNNFIDRLLNEPDLCKLRRNQSHLY